MSNEIYEKVLQQTVYKQNADLRKLNEDVDRLKRRVIFENELNEDIQTRLDFYKKRCAFFEKVSISLFALLVVFALVKSITCLYGIV